MSLVVFVTGHDSEGVDDGGLSEGEGETDAELGSHHPMEWGYPLLLR